MICCLYTKRLFDQLATVCVEYTQERITRDECWALCRAIRYAVRRHAEISGHALLGHYTVGKPGGVAIRS
jgi:hypothetical protein